MRQQVIGGPSWLDTDRFDIEAKNDRTISADQSWLMVQAFLQDRFQLKVHRDTRELPVYNLVSAKGGIKMKSSADQSLPHRYDEDDPPNSISDSSALPARGEATFTRAASGEIILTGNAMSVSPNLAIRRPHSLPPRSLTTLLQGELDRPVLDKTNLRGLFDFRIQFAIESLSRNPDVPGTSIFTALQEQLGLRLEPTKGPVEVIVIDSVQKPSEN
jgi:uncharacterized protein (TIGR03435 family)